jgi:hypothetical protein
LTPEDAFMASQFDSFITHDVALRARKAEIDGSGPLIIGIDPAGMGADSTAIAWRRGSCIEKIEKRHGLDTMQVAGWVAQIIREDKPTKVNIDVGGLGAGVYDRLAEQGYGGFGSGIINRANFGGKPVEPPPLEMRKRGMPSPDEDDAMALWFSAPMGAPLVSNSNFNRKIEYPRLSVA